MTRPPDKGPDLDYPERRALTSKTPTGEFDLRMLGRAERKRASRRPKEIAAGVAAIIVALGGATTGVVKAFAAHDRADVAEYRLLQAEGELKTLRGQVDHTRLKLAGCHCPEGIDHGP